MCISFVCTIFKVVSYYDLSVLSMSVMGIIFFDRRWVGSCKAPYRLLQLSSRYLFIAAREILTFTLAESTNPLRRQRRQCQYGEQRKTGRNEGHYVTVEPLAGMATRDRPTISKILRLLLVRCYYLLPKK